MAKSKKQPTESPSTEEKIKEAARKVFMQKGFAATRTRDIAGEAGINLALLNYYFRSKQKLFDEVMKEKIQTLLATVIPILMDASTSLEEKIRKVTSNYIKVLSENNDLPIFVLNELRDSGSEIIANLPGKLLLKTSFFQQLQQRKKNIEPVHFLINMLGLIVFPFVAKPILTKAGMVSEKKFHQLIRERERLIPQWMDSILKQQETA
jgi:AcrR family transcriptional regulator